MSTLAALLLERGTNYRAGEGLNHSAFQSMDHLIRDKLGLYGLLIHVNYVREVGESSKDESVIYNWHK